MKLYYVVNARMPTEKAHGIQIAKMCEAFIERGIEVVIVAPRRATHDASLRAFYDLRVEVPIVRLWVLDWYARGRYCYAIASLSFMGAYVLFLLRKKLSGESFVVYSMALDTFSCAALGVVRRPVFIEVHYAHHATLAGQLLFTQVSGVIAINTIIKQELQQRFPRGFVPYAIEPNGVDLTSFVPMDKCVARASLGIEPDVLMVVYTGRFFDWKGLEILPRTAQLTPEIRWQIVGGTREEFAASVGGVIPSNMHFAGSRPHNEIPLWCSAADALLVLGTKRDVQSYRYTSPMKLFEYLATGRPVVVSHTPAIKQIVSAEEVYRYEPDDECDLARVLTAVVAPGADHTAHLRAAYHKAEQSSWSARAERIHAFMDHIDAVKV